VQQGVEQLNGPAIHTVRGPVAPAALGRVLPHEHLLCDLYRITGHSDHLLNDEELACEELASLTAAGGTALVEATPIDLGRNPEGLRRISEATGVHIVMGTGWYRQPYYPPEIDRWDTNHLADIMVAELTEGVGETGIRAGIIGEIGVDRDYATAAEERVLRAVARAHLRTGAPITTHASLFPVGLVQLALLQEEGVDPARVIIGHADTYLNHEYHLAVLKTGAYLQFDTIAREHLNPDARRAAALVRLLRDGWGERLLLSSDRCFRTDLKACGGVGYDIVFTRFFDRLRALGVGDDELRLLTEANPRRILAW
jgi:phosphotriesterase-related protein